MTTFPVYLVVDASYSLSGDIHTVNQALAELIDVLRNEPIAAESVRVGVIQFESEAHVVLPLSDVRAITTYPSVAARGGTNYGAAFRLARGVIESDVARLKNEGERVFRPFMVFISDGSPSDLDWQKPLQDLQSPGFRSRPTIVAFGIGSVDPRVLREVGSSNGGAFVVSSRLSTSQAIRSIFQGLTTVLTSTLQSSVSPGAPAASITLSDDWLNLSSIPEGL